MWRVPVTQGRRLSIPLTAKDWDIESLGIVDFLVLRD
jgi:hypothetical protein